MLERIRDLSKLLPQPALELKNVNVPGRAALRIAYTLHIGRKQDDCNLFHSKIEISAV